MVGGEDPEESAEVEAADGGMLGGLVLKWFAVLGRVLGPDMAPTAGVGDRLSLTVVTASCRGIIVPTKKSSAGTLMVTTGCCFDVMCFL